MSHQIWGTPNDGLQFKKHEKVKRHSETEASRQPGLQLIKRQHLRELVNQKSFVDFQLKCFGWQASLKVTWKAWNGNMEELQLDITPFQGQRPLQSRILFVASKTGWGFQSTQNTLESLESHLGPFIPAQNGTAKKIRNHQLDNSCVRVTKRTPATVSM